MGFSFSTDDVSFLHSKMVVPHMRTVLPVKLSVRYMALPERTTVYLYRGIKNISKSKATADRQSNPFFDLMALQIDNAVRNTWSKDGFDFSSCCCGCELRIFSSIATTYGVAHQPISGSSVAMNTVSHSGHETLCPIIDSGSSNSVSQEGQKTVVMPRIPLLSFAKCFEGEFEAFDFAFEPGDLRILLRYQRGEGGVGRRGGCAFWIVGEA